MPTFRNFLIDILQKPELSSNKVAWTIAKYPNLNLSSRETFYESVRSFYPFYESSLSEIEKEKDNLDAFETKHFLNKDFRIKNLKVSGIRGFQFSEKPFGINFCIDDNPEPHSAIILGSNGVGKSSIFDALEYMFCGRIGEFELRNYDEQFEDYSLPFRTYLTNLALGNGSPLCEIETQDKKYEFPHELFPEAVRKKLIPNSFFISEFDVFQIGKLDFTISNDRSIHYFIADNLGLKEYLNFIKILNQFESYNRVKETRSLNSLNKEIEDLTNKITTWETEIEKRNENIQALLSNIPKSTPTEDRFKNHSLIISQLSDRAITISRDDKLSDDYESFLGAYRELREVPISIDEENTNEFLELGLELLNNSSNCPFCDDSNKSIDEIESYVRVRINNLKLFSERRKNLANRYNDYYYSIRRIVDTINFAKDLISRETTSEIVSIPEILDLVNENKELSQKLDQYHDFFSKILIDNSQFSIAGAESLYKLLSGNKQPFVDEIQKFYSDSDNYINKRREILEKATKILERKNTPVAQDSLQLQSINQNEIRQFTQERNNAQIRLNSALKEREEAQVNVDIYQAIKREAIDYRNVVKIEIDKKISDVFDPIKDVVESLLNEFDLDDGYTIRVGKGLETDEETGEIISEYIKIYALKDEKEYDVKKYLNAFRYKLFCLILGFSVAIANRKMNNLRVNLPFVIDDIFYSSDFEKRLLVEEFIGKLFDLHEKYCPDLPIQLILFTHDELIFDCILSKLIKKGIANKTIFARLISQNDTIDMPSYKELLYKIPNDIPDLINKNMQDLLNFMQPEP